MAPSSVVRDGSEDRGGSVGQSKSGAKATRLSDQCFFVSIIWYYRDALLSCPCLDKARDDEYGGRDSEAERFDEEGEGDGVELFFVICK
ncbi:hypothetical protein CDL15_Pgr018377 [Punica granatum]|uniref:Uncharacterized protein n=1 Tax=Punica granatum TaxID=22663 RepID=A0A218WI62_PUNGR|nr:hypothetical protein CDL15_Pgr018377 [Punica granatum]